VLEYRCKYNFLVTSTSYKTRLYKLLVVSAVFIILFNYLQLNKQKFVFMCSHMSRTRENELNIFALPGITNPNLSAVGILDTK
jgi:hypothetical protein